MKILIVSDSHGHNEILDDLIRDYKDIDIFLHAGDSEVPPHTLFPFRVVQLLAKFPNGGNSLWIWRVADVGDDGNWRIPHGNVLKRHDALLPQDGLWSFHASQLFIFAASLNETTSAAAAIAAHAAASRNTMLFPTLLSIVFYSHLRIMPCPLRPCQVPR